MKHFRLSILLSFGLIPLLQAEPGWTKYADNKIFAQSVVNSVLEKHHDLAALVLHAVHPGSKEENIIAANLDRIGKKDDDDDLFVAQEHRIVLAPNLTDPLKYEVLIPLQDGSGHFIGTIGCVFKYHSGDSEIGLLKRALAIRDEIARKVPSLEALFQSAE